MSRPMRLPARLLQRSPKAHKGDFGHLLVLAGSARFSGAAALCSEAAMRSGAGLVTLGIPAGLNSAMIKIKSKEVMTLPLPQTKEGSLSLAGYARIKNFSKNIDALVIGPGLSQDKSTLGLARKVVGSVKKPMVIDADGLNALAKDLKVLRTAANRQQPTIITPHPAEMSRLSGISIDKIQCNRSQIARKFSRDYKVTLILKGDHTLVVDKGKDLYINKTGNPGMATAGSGDVLSGMIGAFLSQGLSAFQAAKYAVYLHGLAGDLAAKKKTQISLIASDIIAQIPEAIKRCS